MRVGANDGVGPFRDQPAGHVFLLGAVPGFIFYAPVGEDQDDIGLGAGAGHDRGQGLPAHPLHLGPAGGGALVGAVGEVHQGYLDALHLQDERVQERIGLLGCGYAGVKDAQVFQLAYGAGQSFETFVQDVVVGRQEHIEPHVR